MYSGSDSRDMSYNKKFSFLQLNGIDWTGQLNT
jgi:hypothetical protein